MSLLAIDFGLAKIGLAFSEGELASPLTIIKVKNPERALSQILTLVDTHRVEKILVGIPAPDSIGAEKFAKQLETALELPVVRVDETMTTNIASKKAKKGEEDDSIAATVLLQEYLDQSRGGKFAI
jgi:putative transcription antitermination factor YqgF